MNEIADAMMVQATGADMVSRRITQDDPRQIGYHMLRMNMIEGDFCP